MLFKISKVFWVSSIGLLVIIDHKFTRILYEKHANKIRAYNLQDKGFDTVEANHQLGFKEDERGYGIVSDMINFLGIKTVDLMTNNPKKIKALEAMGIVVNQRVPLYSSTNKYNEKYISTKVKKLGHLI